MQAIFASGVATGKYAMGSNEPLGELAEPETIDVDAEAPPTATEANVEPVEPRPGQALGKRKTISEEEGCYLTGLTEAVWGFANAVKESTHSEGAPGIVKAVMDCTNYPKPALMFCLDHLMEHKRSAMGFLDMDAEQKDLCLASFLAKNNYFM